MSSLILKPAKKSYTKMIKPMLLSILFISSVAHTWEIDMSRRNRDFKKSSTEYSARLPASLVTGQTVPAEGADIVTGEIAKPKIPMVSEVFRGAEPVQDVVIMSTETGFVPETLRLRKDQTYNIHVVNVNAKEKNVSFILDAFSESHATYFGVVKTFTIRPKVDGIFSYQSPETAFQGRLIVFSDEKTNAARRLASEGK